MSKSKAITPFIPPASTPTQVEGYLRGFVDLEQKNERGRILSQALQGLCLSQLQEQYGFKQGHHGTKPTRCGFSSWAEYLDKTWKMSDETASRRMKCWTAVAARIGKLAGPDAKSVYGLLAKPLAEISDKEWSLLQAVTHKVTDAASQAELIAEAKYLIQEHGSGIGKGKGKAKKDDAEDGDGETPAPTPELLIQDELFNPIHRLSEHWHSPLTIEGKAKAPLWQHMTKAQLRKAVETLEGMIVPAREALENK